jgi:16S rRNA (uracil1498-N3)-methyltransferase
LTTPRIYLPSDMRRGDMCELDGETRHYLKSVLRMKAGESLRLFNGTGKEYEAVVRNIGSGGVTVEITGESVIPARPISITLSQGLPKAGKMDFIVQKATELGADRIIPFLASRSVPRLTPDGAEAKAARWRRIALEAARKCGSGGIPEIKGIMSFEGMLKEAGEEPLKLILWEEETGTGLREIMHAGRYADTRDFFVVVGPEGGFTGKEVETALSRNFISVSMGNRILKAETAALAILSILHYERGNNGKGSTQG